MGNSKSWMDRGVIDFDWIVGGEEYWKEDFARFKVERAASLSCSVYFFAVQIGGYTVYPGKYAPLAPKLSEDLLNAVIREVRERNMKFGVYWLSTNPSAAYQLENHPDWQGLRRDGSPTGCVCYMSPYGRFVLRQVEEVLERYEIDAVYFDQLSTACYCPYCRDRFKRRFGMDLTAAEEMAEPVEETMQAPHIEMEKGGLPIIGRTVITRRFTRENTDWWIKSVRGIIDRQRPSAVYMQGKLWGETLRRYRPQLDAVLPEVLWWTVGYDLDRLMLHRELSRLFIGGRPCLDEAKYDDTNVQRHTLEEVKLLLANGMTGGCQPFLRECRAGDLAPHSRKGLEAFMSDLKTLVEKRDSMNRISTCGLLHSTGFESRHPNDMGNAVAGAYRLMREHQVPLGILWEGGLSEKNLNGLSVIVVPEYTGLRPEAENALADFVRKGGTVIAALGEVPPEADLEFEGRPLMKMLGVKVLGMSGYSSDTPAPSLSGTAMIPAHTRKPYNYGEILEAGSVTAGLDGTIFTFSHPYLDATYAESPEVNSILSCRDIDQTKLAIHPFNRRSFWPGKVVCPLGVVHEGKGRLVFMAFSVFDLDARARTMELDELLIRLMKQRKENGNEIEIVDAPRSLRMIVYVDEEKKEYLIILSNQAFNDPRDRNIRYVHPSQPVFMKINPRFSVESAVSLTGGKPKAEKKDGSLLIEIPSVQYLEGVLVR